MLINEIAEYCNSEYTNSNPTCLCNDCNHPTQCSGSCKKCLEQIHYPNRHPKGKNDYDCKKMMNFYVCDYINKYASEMLYLLNKSDKLRKIDEYHILSIGCGPAPDLMAFEQYVLEHDDNKGIRYCGFDKNNLWSDIHNKVKDYQSNDIVVQFKYTDVIEYFETHSIKDVNVIIFQYVISHFYNTNQIQYIQEFFVNIVSKVVEHKKDDEPLIILINDTNSCNRGRDYFIDLCQVLKKKGFHGNCQKFYFDYRIQNEAQRYGVCHKKRHTLFDLSNIDLTKYEPWTTCSSAQLLIEIE